MSTVPVQIFFRVVYGNQLMYPANALAEKLAQFANVKTFTDTQLLRLKEAGFYIESVRDPREQLPSCFDKDAEADRAVKLRQMAEGRRPQGVV